MQNSPEPSRAPDIDSLIEAALAGQLSVEEHTRLEEQLRTSPEFRQTWLEALQIHLDLNRLSELPDWPACAPDQVCAPDPVCDPDPVCAPEVVPSQHVPVITRSRVRLAIAGCSAVLLIAVMIPGLFRDRIRDSLSTPVADAVTSAAPPQGPVITETAQALFFGEGLIPEPGRQLVLQQKYVLTQGLLALRFFAGAQVILKAPASFVVSDPAVLQLYSGHCSVHAPPGAEGFQVLSPAAKVIDLGTRFSVDVDQTGGTELFVVEGAASLTAAEDASRSPVLLRQGESMKVEPGSSPRPPSRSLTQSTYLDNLPDRVVRYDAVRTAQGTVEELLAIAVQRAGVVRNYPRAQLIRSRLTAFTCPAKSGGLLLQMSRELPTGQARLALLDEDWSLVSGLANPRHSLDQNQENFSEPVMAVEFVRPVRNGPGPDIVLFDLELLVGAPEGNLFRVRSGDPDGPGTIHMIERFDIGLNSPAALDLAPYRLFHNARDLRSVNDILTGDFVPHGRQVHIDSKALAVGIDLSDLGYEPDESLTRLEILGVPRSISRDMVDPTLIVGLPDMRESLTALDRRLPGQGDKVAGGTSRQR